MRLLTYVFAAALLWAIAATGPSIADAPREAAPRASAQSAPPGTSVPAYPR